MRDVFTHDDTKELPLPPLDGSREQLEQLWSLLLVDCLKYLQGTPPGKRRIKRLEVIRGFLKDNNMVIDGVHLEDVAKNLAKLSALDLPFGGHQHH